MHAVLVLKRVNNKINFIMLVLKQVTEPSNAYSYS